MPLDSLDGFLRKCASGLTPDVEKLSALPSAEFRLGYVGDMMRYMQNHGHPVTCECCHGQVMRPDDLVRYFGGNQHFGCFRRTLFIDKRKAEGQPGALKPYERAYFDLILHSLAA